MGVNKSMLPAPESEGDVICAGNVRIRYRCWGQGAPLVLLHGNGEDYTCFYNQIPEFFIKYRVIAIDSRGHGVSGMGEPFSLIAMSRDVKEVLDALSLERVSMIGFSDGGNVALYFALRYASRLNRLVVAGANLFPAGVEGKTRALIRAKYQFVAVMGKANTKFAQKAKVLGLMLDEPSIDPWELESVEAKTLVLVGEKDVILREHTNLIVKSIPDAHLRTIPSCGHFIFRDQPEWVNATIIKFLNGIYSNSTDYRSLTKD